MEIREVTTRRDRSRFVKFPYQIYQHDPHWVAPLELERLEFIDRRRHPFFKHGDAIPLLALDGGNVVGRVLASDDPRFNAEHGTNLGAFGMFECVNDPLAAQTLLNAVETWLRQRGRTAVRGPYDYSLNYQCGLLVDGFDTPPRLMMNHNPPYYAALIEQCGYQKAKDLLAYWFVNRNEKLLRWQTRVERLADRDVVIRSPQPRNLIAEFQRCTPIYNAAWQRNWGAVRMTDAEFEHFGRLLKQIAEPDLLLVAEVSGQPVGFSMTLPDANEALQPLHGRLTRWGLPIGVIKLLWGMKHIRHCRLVALGVLDEYRGRGIAERLILETLRRGANDFKYKGAELSWTLEDNRLINRTIESVGGERYKTYRVYEKSLEPRL